MKKLLALLMILSLLPLGGFAEIAPGSEARDMPVKVAGPVSGTKDDIIQALSSALFEHNIIVKLDSTSGDIVIDSSDLFFESNRAVLSADSKAFLDAFIPVYLDVLLRPEYSDCLEYIIIESHSDLSGTYERNMELTQERALEVLLYIRSMYQYDQNTLARLDKILIATGRGYTDPIYYAYAGQRFIDQDACRRVEFKFSLRDAEMTNPDAELEALRAYSATLEAENANLTAAYAMMETEISQFQMTINDYAAAIASGEDRIAELEAQLQAYAAALAEREARIAEQEALINAHHDVSIDALAALYAAYDALSMSPEGSQQPSSAPSSLEEQLESFFYFWRVNNDESMLALCAPSWHERQTNPEQSLFSILANRTPENDMDIVSVSGSDADTMRVARVNVTINANNGRLPQRYAFHIYMLQEDGVWYVDPQSLAMR